MSRSASRSFVAVKYFRKYIPRTLSLRPTYCTCSLTSIGCISYRHITRYHRAVKNRGSLLSKRPSYRWRSRSAENVFPHSGSIDLRVRFGIRLAGICSLAARARRLGEIYLCLQSVRNFAFREGCCARGENSTGEIRAPRNSDSFSAISIAEYGKRRRICEPRTDLARCREVRPR